MKTSLNGTTYKGFAQTTQALPERMEAMRGKDIMHSSMARVLAVHPDTMTCDIENANGVELSNVPILARCGLEGEEVYGEVELPSPEQYVLIGFVGDRESFPFVLGTFYPYANEFYQDSQVPVNSANKQFTLKLLEADMSEKQYRKIFKSGTSIEVQEDGSIIMETPDGSYLRWFMDLEGDLTEIELHDMHENIIKINALGLSITDINLNNVEFTDAGIVVTDLNANVVTMSSSGMTLECANGNVIEMGSSSVLINGNLEVLQ